MVGAIRHGNRKIPLPATPAMNGYHLPDNRRAENQRLQLHMQSSRGGMGHTSKQQHAAGSLRSRSDGVRLSAPSSKHGAAQVPRQAQAVRDRHPAQLPARERGGGQAGCAAHCRADLRTWPQPCWCRSSRRSHTSLSAACSSKRLCRPWTMPCCMHTLPFSGMLQGHFTEHLPITCRRMFRHDTGCGHRSQQALQPQRRRTLLHQQRVALLVRQRGRGKRAAVDRARHHLRAWPCTQAERAFPCRCHTPAMLTAWLCHLQKSTQQSPVQHASAHAVTTEYSHCRRHQYWAANLGLVCTLSEHDGKSTNGSRHAPEE